MRLVQCISDATLPKCLQRWRMSKEQRQHGNSGLPKNDIEANSMGTKIIIHLHWVNESSTRVRRARYTHQVRSFELRRTITWLLRRSAPDENIGILRTKAPGTRRESHTLDKFAQWRASRWKQTFLPAKRMTFDEKFCSKCREWPLTKSSVVNKEESLWF
jgi:hypothetical protein